MARIKIELPKTFLFETKLQIRVSDLNYGNHLANNAVLGLMHEARIHFIRHFGFNDEKAVFGIGLIMTDTAIVFQQEGFLGEMLTIHIALGEFSRVGFDMLYLITKADGSALASAKTGMVCFDYEKRKVAACPAEMLASWQN